MFDDIDCRESAGRGPVVPLKVIRVTGASFSGTPMSVQSLRAPLFPLSVSTREAACKLPGCTFLYFIELFNDWGGGGGIPQFFPGDVSKAALPGDGNK